MGRSDPADGLDRERHRGRYVVGDPLPRERELLPQSPWSRDVCTIAEQTERVPEPVLVDGRRCVRCERYGPDHDGAHIGAWEEAR